MNRHGETEKSTQLRMAHDDDDDSLKYTYIFTAFLFLLIIHCTVSITEEKKETALPRIGINKKEYMFLFI